MVSEAESTGDPLIFLQQQPQFLALRRAVQSNPAVLPQLLQELGQANPELLQVCIFIFAAKNNFSDNSVKVGSNPNGKKCLLIKPK